jgi:AraC-like DNA-binding protein
MNSGTFLLDSKHKHELQDSSCLISSAFTRVDSVSQVWNGIDVHYSEKYPVSGESWAELHSDQTSVIIRLEQRGGSCEPRLKPNESIPKSRRDAGFFNWIPADHTIWCYSRNVRILRDLQLFFDVTTLESILEDECDLSRAHEPLLMVYDSRVRDCAHLLADAFARELRHDRLYGESLTVALIVALLHATRHLANQQPVTGLMPRELRIAKEYLEQEVAKDLSLAELARLVGLSRSRLARGFKASTGVAPYTWALQFRIQKAKELLKKRDQPIVATALEMGFADQSHFTKTFRRVAGITPGEWRRQYKWNGEPDAG